MGGERKQATDAGVVDVPRREDEHRLEPKVSWGNGPVPPVVGIDARADQPAERTASEQAYDGPGLSAAIELLKMPRPNHLAIAAEMVAHPSERDAILDEVRRRGDPRLVELVQKAESEQREAERKPIKIGKQGPQVGDTKVYPAPAFSTTDERDTYQAAEAAREARQRARDAQRRGDKPYDPLGDQLRGKDAPTQDERNAARKADEAIDGARKQLLPDGGQADGGTR